MHPVKAKSNKVKMPVFLCFRIIFLEIVTKYQCVISARHWMLQYGSVRFIEQILYFQVNIQFPFFKGDVSPDIEVVHNVGIQHIQFGGFVIACGREPFAVITPKPGKVVAKA
jgi:hypothetical protein